MQIKETETETMPDEQDVLPADFWLSNSGNSIETDFLKGFLPPQAGVAKTAAVTTLSVSKTACATIRSLCSDQSALVFNFYATAFSILVARYFSLTEVSFLAPYAQFDDTNDEEHFFLFRSFIDQQQSFKEIFVRNKAFLSTSMLYNDTCHNISQHTDPEIVAAWSQLGFTLNYPDHIYSKHRQTFSCGIVEDNDAPFLHVQYDNRLCSGTIIELFLHNLQYLLDEIIDKIYQPVHALRIDSARERMMLSGFNATDRNYPLDKTIVELFEGQVRKTPDNIAVTSDAGKLSYNALNILANRFATYLTKNYELRKDDLITVKLQRSEWMMVVMLGIFKSGAAYLPVDMDYPADRTDYIISHSGSKALIDDQVLEHFRDEMDNYPETNLPFKPGPADLAYVIYTSGSTGKPKGVMVEHLGMLNHLLAKQDLLNLHAGSTVVQNASQSFDISVWQFFAVLLGGGKVIIYGKDTVTNPAALIDRLSGDRPEILEVVPSFLDAMLDVYDELSYKNLDFLTHMIVTGEELRHTLVARWFRHFPGKTLVNAYGPTEASDDITHHVMNGFADNNKRVPVGRTVANMKIYIVDDCMNLCPVGVKGEICVSGAGVGRGYLNDREKTDRVFMDDPFAGATGVRLYKTGDTGRYIENGCIEFFGRRDEQVKIRGNRIEPGEIESVLQCYEGVQSVVVLAVPTAGGEKELVAGMITTTGFNEAGLRPFLDKALPAYMMPAAFMQLPSFPLTPNGKIDRKKMIASLDEERRGLAAYVPGRNETERRLISIWQHILGRERIGIKDNFLELGGHSLRVTRLAGKISKEFNVRVTIKQLFSAAILEEQALLIDEASKKSFVEIPVTEQSASYPLSAQQERLWMLCQFEGAGSAYNIPRAYVFDGALDTAAFQYAFNALITRHEILRTVFRTDEEGNIRQYVLEPEAYGLAINTHDATHYREDEQQQQIKALIYEDFNRSFDLAYGPLLRVGLMRLGESRWLFTYVMHHIISDGWSMDVLFNELITGYISYTRNTFHSQDDLRIQYRDYVHWQQLQLSRENVTDLRNYWLTRLGGELPVLQLPVQKTRPAVKTYNGAVFYQEINADMSSRLNAFAQRKGGSLFMGLLAIVNTLLYRYTNQEDIIIGTPIAGREHSDLEGQIGIYINTLALRSQFKGEHSFDQVFDIVKNVTLEAYEHQAYPFDRLVGELNLPRDISRSPLFDVMVILQNTGGNAKSTLPVLDTLRISGYDTEAYVTSKFDLTFNFFEVDGQLQAAIEYNSDIFDHAMIERMAEHLLQLSESLIREPFLPIREVDYLGPREKNLLLEQFNPQVRSSAATQTITALFEERAQTEPGAVAMIFEGRKFTCAELNQRANRLAAYLRANYGITANDLVAIKLIRNEWMVITMMGILKSGAAYLPIDTSSPEERVSYILQDSHCKVLIDEAELDKFFKTESQYSGNNLPQVNTPHDLAYVMYTSGSTGRPKGVMIEQKSVVDFLPNFKSRFFLEKNMVLGAVTNYTFDISVLELLGSLVSGIKLFLIASKDPAVILQHIKCGEIDALQLTPSRLHQLLEVEGCNVHTLGLLRVLLIGGEALGQNDFSLLKQLESTQVINVYGPTETTIWSSALHLKNAGSLSVGQPLLNEQIFIINEAFQLCPVGVTGEICIGGAGLARGYLNNPALTAEKFVANPFRTGERIYRTGDLGTWQADGNILFAGRTDEQIKIQGHRIEPGEIEYALLQHAAIDEAVVVGRTATLGKQLAAYIKSAKTLQANEVRSYLGRSLPDYMVPSLVIQLEEFPLTASGKINRKKLLEIDAGEMMPETVYMAPRDETEEQLTLIWQEILNRQKIGIKDDFFAAGGNSLVAIKVLSRIRKQLGVDIRIENLFNNLTIESLAKEVSRKKWAAGELIIDTPEISTVTI